MKHPDRVKAEADRREAANVEETARAYRGAAARCVGFANLRDAYEHAAATLGALAAAMRERADYYEESARSEGG